MAIVISLPDAPKTVTIPNYDTMQELLEADDVYLQKLSYSFLFFRWMLAYAELFNRGEFDEEEIKLHLEAASIAYKSDMELAALENDKISEKIEEIVHEEGFDERYKIFMDNFVTEIFSLFASGALAGEEGKLLFDTDFQLGHMKAGQA